MLLAARDRPSTRASAYAPVAASALCTTIEIAYARTGATASPRYFQLRDAGKGLVVSGWFESESSWQGFGKFVVGELQALKKAGQLPTKAPEVVAAGSWQAFSYEVGLPGGASANVRAELIRAGTWIDLHISVSGSGPPGELREQAVQFLKGIMVTEKP